MSVDVGDVGARLLRHARISDCGQYRYTLWRRWDVTLPLVVFVMLNPSTADGETDDPTIRRCIGFARTWGYGAVHVVNLYAWRARDPRELRTAEDPVGPDNDRTLAEYGNDGVPLIAAWGVNADPARVAHVLKIDGFDRLRALGATKDGHPRHPLYVRGDAKPQPWPVA